MGARKRTSIEPVTSSESQMTYSRFLELFPDNDACLDYLKAKFHPDDSYCPGCRKASKFHRIKSRAAYSCQYCRHQVYPTAGTIFHKSTTSLQLWFWAIYLMSSTRCGMSAKQLEREIGVSYPTAHRMFKQIRYLLGDDDTLIGTVEADETYVGGPERGKRGRPGRDSKKVPVFGLAQRKTTMKPGKIIARVVEDASEASLMPHIRKRVLPSSVVYTDEWKAYSHVGEHVTEHRRINHQQAIYVDGDVHTNSVEGFWGLLKGGLIGVYHGVSDRYLQHYLDEYSFRYNRRGVPIFWAILDRVQKDGLAAE